MNKRISILPFLLAVGATAGSIRGNRRLSNEVLFAKYDWLVRINTIRFVEMMNMFDRIERSLTPSFPHQNHRTEPRT